MTKRREPPNALALGTKGDELIVVASGRGELAKSLLRAARRWGIPAQPDSDLVRELEVLPEEISAGAFEKLRRFLR